MGRAKAFEATDLPLPMATPPAMATGDASANLLTNPALDPTSKMPEFKVCAARLEPVPPAPALVRSCP
ncbi:MAG: hypothetical protein ACR2KK_14785 [Acidimicrobiales bacterium]